MLESENLHATIGGKPMLSCFTCLLPTQFAVEAQKLLGINFEGSVG